MTFMLRRCSLVSESLQPMLQLSMYYSTVMDTPTRALEKMSWWHVFPCFFNDVSNPSILEWASEIWFINNRFICDICLSFGSLDHVTVTSVQPPLSPTWTLKSPGPIPRGRLVATKMHSPLVLRSWYMDQWQIGMNLLLTPYSFTLPPVRKSFLQTSMSSFVFLSKITRQYIFNWDLNIEIFREKSKRHYRKIKERLHIPLKD